MNSASISTHRSDPLVRSLPGRSLRCRAAACGSLAAAAFVTFATLGAPRPAAADVGRWTTNGPYGGLVSALAIDPKTPSRLYAVGNGAIFRSTDSGATWVPSDDGIVDRSVQSIAIDPVTPGTLYAGTVQGGSLVRSTDGGVTWRTLTGAPTLGVAIAIDPKTPATLYVGQLQNGIRKSTDGGATWANIGVQTLPTFGTFKAIVVDPKTPTTIYAGESSRGLFRSTDGGATWTLATTGMTGPIVQVLGIAIDPVTPSTLYTVASTSGGDGLFKSTDSGDHWTRILAPATANGFFIGSVAVNPQVPSTIYVGTANGTFASTDAGLTFTAVRSGLPVAFVNAIAINPQAPSTLFAGTTVGIYATANSGAAWSASNAGLSLNTVTALALDPVVPTTVYAGTRLAGLYKSVDAGATWTAINSGAIPTGNSGCAFPQISGIVVDPTKPSTVYASTQCTQSAQVLKSVNGGATWTAAANGIPVFTSISALAIDPSNPAHLVVGTFNNGAFLTNDAGATWTHATTGMPDGSGIVGLAYSSAASPTRTLWAAVKTPNAGDTFYNSSNGGSSWSSTYPGFDTTMGIAPVVRFLYQSVGIRSMMLNPNPAFAPAFYLPLPTIQGIADLTTCFPVTALHADPASATEGYIGAGCGVLKSSGNLSVLTAMNDGLPANPALDAMVASPRGDRLYAGSVSGGVYTFSTGATIGTVVEFYNATLDNYFITADPIEAAAVDAGGAGPGWSRTGAQFGFNSGGDTYVCRFYGSLSPGPNSHFYTASTPECNGLKALQVSTPANQPHWNFESLDFATRQPVNGACPAGTTPVYRAYNNGFARGIDSNHRITSSQAGIQQVVARGWVSEGIVMCAPN